MSPGTIGASDNVSSSAASVPARVFACGSAAGNGLTRPLPADVVGAAEHVEIDGDDAGYVLNRGDDFGERHRLPERTRREAEVRREAR